MSRHDELDSQLPWIQVHRSVGAKAAALAARCGADYYRVRGILEAFWESLADRRVLQKALEGPGCIILATPEVESRLCRLISPTCTPADVEAAGFVARIEPEYESEPCAYRVRGMSRYLDAERTRLARRRGPTPVQPHPNPTPTPTAPPTPPGSDPTEERGERREVRGERKEVVGSPCAPGSPCRQHPGHAHPPLQDSPPTPVSEAAAPPPATPPQLDAVRARAVELHQHLQAPDTPPEAWGAEDFWRWAQVTRRDNGKLLVERWPDHRDLARWWGEARLVASVEALQEAFLAFGDDLHWQAAKPPLPWAGFGGPKGQWAKFLPQGPGGAHAAAR